MRFGCGICFQTINPPGVDLPAAKCATCGKYYHSACLSRQLEAEGLCPDCRTECQSVKVSSESLKVSRRVADPQLICRPANLLPKEDNRKQEKDKKAPKAKKVRPPREVLARQTFGLAWLLTLFLAFPIAIEQLRGFFDRISTSRPWPWGPTLEWNVYLTIFVIIAAWLFLRRLEWPVWLKYLGFGIIGLVAAAVAAGLRTGPQIVLPLTIGAIAILSWLGFLRWYGYTIHNVTIDQVGRRVEAGSLRIALFQGVMFLAAGLLSTLSIYHLSRQGLISNSQALLGEANLTWGIWQAIVATATTAVVFFATLSNVTLRQSLLTLGVFTIAPLMVVGWTTPPKAADTGPAATTKADPGSESEAANQSENMNQSPIEKSLSKTPLGRNVLNFSLTWAQRLGLTAELVAGLMLSVIISAFATTIAIWPLRFLGFFLSK